MLVVLAAGSRAQIGCAGADDACGIPGLDLYLAAFKKLEQTLGMFLFLQGCFLKNFLHQHIAVFFGLTGKKIIAVAGLGFAGKGRKNVLLGLAAFQGFHRCLSLHKKCRVED